jgi:hypothetical protein
MMENAISTENLKALCAAVHDDSDALEVIADCLNSFEDYHGAIYEMETWLRLHDYENTPREDYQVKLEKMDAHRTSCHDVVLDSVNILNRMAGHHDIPAIYSGEMSAMQPIRREVADAVLEYVEGVVSQRR